MGVAGIEACHRTVFALLYRNLFLVPVVPGLSHTYNGMHDQINLFRCKTADPDQVFSHFFLLESKLLFVVQSLDLAAAAGLCNGTAGLHTEGGGLQDPVEMAVGIVGSHFGDGHFDRVAGHSIFDKDGKALFHRLLFPLLFSFIYCFCSINNLSICICICTCNFNCICIAVLLLF